MAKKKNQDITTEAVGEESSVDSKRSNKNIGGSTRSKSTSSATSKTSAGSATASTAVDAASVATTAEHEPIVQADTSYDVVQEEGGAPTENLADSAALYAADAAMQSVASTEDSIAQMDAAVQHIAADTDSVERKSVEETASATANTAGGNTTSSTSTAATLDALTAAEQVAASVSSKSDAEGLLSDYHYNESDSVLNAYAALETYLNSAPEEYTSSHQEQIDSLLEQILNREDFSYDFDADPLYQQYKNQYEHSALLAMQDTMAQAQAATGGYGSSYAAQAASGAYQSELNELTGVMPELYELAYSRYSDQGAGMMDHLSALTEQEKVAQSLYQDLVGNYYTGLESATQTAENAYAKDYEQYQDSLSYLQELLDYYAGQEQQAFENEQAQQEYELALKEYEESARQWEAELASQQSQWWAKFDASQTAANTTSTASGSGTSASKASGTSSGGTSGFSLSDTAKDIKTTITQEMRVYAAEGANSTDIHEAVADILATYYRTGYITKEEANAIGVNYSVSF